MFGGGLPACASKRAKAHGIQNSAAESRSLPESPTPLTIRFWSLLRDSPVTQRFSSRSQLSIEDPQSRSAPPPRPHQLLPSGLAKT